MQKQKTNSSTLGPLERLRQETNFIDSKRVVELLGIGESTLRLYTSQGTIPYYRIGRHIRFDPARLAAWLEERQVG